MLNPLVLNSLALIFIGFSIISSLVLLAVYFFNYRAIEKNWRLNSSCCGLLLGLCALQFMHLAYLQGCFSLVDTSIYGVLLLIAATSFYFFGREILQFQTRQGSLMLLAFLPFLVVPLLSPRSLITLAFILGSLYAVLISHLLYALRAQRKRFGLEFLSFVVFALIALLLVCISLLAQEQNFLIYVQAYSVFIGLGFAGITYVLLKYPDVIQNTREAVIASYTTSTLKNVDCDALTSKIKSLFNEQKLHRNEDLSLAQVASELDLTSHQTSELINTQLGMSFSKLVREYRVADAKHQLIEEPKASILSISLSVGFNSQSNFYTAFREITGQTPAQFRKSHGLNSENADF